MNAEFFQGGLAMTRWISVKVRLPKTAATRIVFSPKRGVRTTTEHPSWWNYKDRRGPAYHGPIVTHWMELPAPPKRKRTPEDAL